MSRATASPPAVDGRPAGFGADASQALDAARTEAEQALPLHLPEPGDDDETNKKMNIEMNKAGREALDDGRATVLAMLSHAFRLVPAAQMDALGHLRKQATDAMPGRPEQSHTDTVRRALSEVPTTSVASSVQARKNSAAKAASALLSANMEAGRQPWHDLAAVVASLRALVPTRETLAASSGRRPGTVQVRARRTRPARMPPSSGIFSTI
jgi:hypothetical protein